MSAEQEVGIRLSLKERRAVAEGLRDVSQETRALGNQVESAGRKAVDHGAKGFDRMAGSARGLAKSVGKGLAVSAVAGVAGLTALTVWAGKGYESLRRIQTIGAQTDAAIRSTGGAANVTRADIDNLAGSLEALTGIEAESITEGQNLLLTFTEIKNGAGAGNRIFDEATRIMTDMSVALGSTAAGSATMLGKALNDPIKGITALSKVGVAFTAQQREQVKALVEAGDTMGAQKIILAELNKEFGGSAEAFGATDTGKIERFNHSLGTLQETVAGAFAPALGQLADFMVNKGVPALDAWGEAFNEDVAPRIAQTIGLVVDLWNVLREDGIHGLVGRIETLTGTQGKLIPILEYVEQVAASLASVWADGVRPALESTAGAALTMLSPLGLVDDLLVFLADHGGLVAGALVAYIAYMVVAKAVTLGFAAAQKVSLIWLKAHTVGTKTHLAVSFAARAATLAWAAAQWALNVALNANPISLLILAGVALIGVLVLMWSKVDWFRAGVLTAFRAVGQAASAVVGWIRANWPTLLAVLTGPIGLAVLVISKNWDTITSGASAAVSWITGAFNSVIEFFTGIGSTITAATSGMWDGVTETGRSAFNTLIDAWNRLDFGISISIPDWVPGVGGKGFKVDDIFPDIPRLAQGAVVTARPGGILANIGEGRWDEAVVPLNGRDYLVNGNGVTPLPTSPAMSIPDAPTFDGFDDKDEISPFPPFHAHLHLDGREVASVVIDDINKKVARS